MGLARKDRALLNKIIEEAGELIKAAVDVQTGKGTWAALADEAADTSAAISVASERFDILSPQRYQQKRDKYGRKFARKS